jgi:hypothetical protein
VTDDSSARWNVGGTRITLDDRDVLRTARTDPGGLVAEAVFPLMIDEVQRRRPSDEHARLGPLVRR